MYRSVIFIYMIIFVTWSGEIIDFAVSFSSKETPGEKAIGMVGYPMILIIISMTGISADIF